MTQETGGLGWRARTGCESCDSGEWQRIEPAWRPIREETGLPEWAATLSVHRCRDCGRYWYTPFDPYDRSYYPEAHPLQLEPLLRPNAGIRDGFAFLDGHAQSAGAFGIAQIYLLRAGYDLGEALSGLAERLPQGGEEEITVRWLRLLEAALAGETGRGAWLAAHRGQDGLPLPRPALDKLNTKLERLEKDVHLASGNVPGLAGEIRRLLARWKNRP